MFRVWAGPTPKLRQRAITGVKRGHNWSRQTAAGHHDTFGAGSWIRKSLLGNLNKGIAANQAYLDIRTDLYGSQESQHYLNKETTEDKRKTVRGFYRK